MSAVIEAGPIGDDTEIYPFASIGLIPQDLKFRGGDASSSAAATSSVSSSRSTAGRAAAAA
jgi:acyl-[acyl carrier protein]--UDP-N-acetylglucosamine O-acyltransferase